MGKVTGQVSAFHTKFDDYIFTEARAEDDDEHGDEDGHELTHMEYVAVEAEFQGIEAEIDWLALENPGWNLLLSAYGDVLRGRIKQKTPISPE